ncbi:MAG: CPBP family intramembrane glutamic endopeptidase [Polyangiaceae bacterium]
MLARRGAAIALWLALFVGLVPLGNRLVPDAVKVRIPLQTFLMTCQILTLVLGLGATLLLVRPRRPALGLDRFPTAPAAVSTILAVPIVFVTASYIALQIALPTLLEELKTRGPQASAQNAGAFGRALTQSPLLVTLLWGALLGALGEELFFRGLLWTTITDVTRRFAPVPASPDLNAYSESPAPAPRPLHHRALRLLLEGGIATLLCAALFGYMHKDLPGGVGIVRLWSTTILGLGLGVVRQSTRSVAACILLHTVYNTFVILAGRKWFGDARSATVLEGIPDTMALLAVLGVAGIGLIAFVRALLARRARADRALELA